MDSFGIYAAMRKNILEVKAQSDRMSVKAAAGTLNASDLHDGIRTNGFEVWFTRLSVLWDARDPAIDLTLQDYGFTTERLAKMGIDLATFQASLTERIPAKVAGFFKAEHQSNLYNPGPDLGALRASMIAARAEAVSLYPTGVGGEDQGRTISVDGFMVQVAFTVPQAATLKTLLDDVSVKCSTLIP